MGGDWIDLYYFGSTLWVGSVENNVGVVVGIFVDFRLVTEEACVMLVIYLASI